MFLIFSAKLFFEIAVWAFGLGLHPSFLWGGTPYTTRSRFCGAMVAKWVLRCALPALAAGQFSDNTQQCQASLM